MRSNLQPKGFSFQSQFVFIFFFFSIHFAFAQISVEPACGAPYTEESLITNIFLGEGVEVVDINTSGDCQAVGYFNNGMDDIGIERGIVMSSGFATTAATQNNAGGTTGNTSGPSSDPDLDGIATQPLNDMFYYTITFIPTNDTLRFKYAFASEEYPEYACSPFNDVFGFFFTGPNPDGGMYNGVNVALVPEPSDPTGLTFTDIPVTINNVNSSGIDIPNGCNYDYGEYYNDNSGSATFTYDGYLDVFIAQAIVIPCEEYTIKLGVADSGDGAFDTAVFLEAKSFGTGSLDIDIATVSLDGTITEGCSDAILSFALPEPVESDFPIDYTIFGTATNGVDYQAIPLDLFIAAGDSSVSVPVIAFEDGIDEPIETIGIDVQRDPCNRDTFYIYIRDNNIVDPVLPNDTTICRLESVYLDGTLNIPLPEPPIFTNNTPIEIVTLSNNDPPPPGTPPTISSLDVFGVQPLLLDSGIIKSVCINVDHVWISDVDVYLVSPNGQVLELTTDNGSFGDDYINTCFTPEATNPINFGNQAPMSAAPFTDTWKPEGVWSDLWDGDNPVNGTWQIQIKDDATGFTGDLLNWSICFNPLYQINYSWEPSAGLSCADCPDPIATPDTTTTYVLTATDSYGCEVTDTITITVLDVLPPPDVNCTNITDNSITWAWPDLPGATGYLVSVDGINWFPPNPGPLSHLENATLSDTITLLVRATAFCDGEIDTTTCFTPDCTPPLGNIMNVIDSDCFGGSTGSLTVSAMGTYPPFTYTLMPNNITNNSGTFSNLPAGTYTVDILDDVSCPTSVLVTVGEPDSLQSTPVLLGNASCNGGADGEATVILQGGTAPYSFLWSNGQMDSIAINLVLGDHYVTITDANTCQLIDTISVVEPEALLLTNLTDSVSCNAAADGTATVTPMGGTAPYTYLWDANAGSQNTPTASNLNGGTYYVTVSDAASCTEIDTIMVVENTALVLSTISTDVDCFGDLDGTGTVTALGGADGYIYEWDLNAASQMTPTATDLAADTFTVVVTDADGCSATTGVNINSPTELSASLTTDSTSCFSGFDGSVLVSTIGGTADYSFQWFDGITSDSTRTDLEAGDYQVTVTDLNTCTQIYDFTILEPEQIALSISATDLTCPNDDNGTATIVASGGDGNYTYLWDDANASTTAIASNLSIGTYNVIVTDGNACNNTVSIEVAAPNALMVSYDSSNVLCYGGSDATIDVSVEGGTGEYTFDWNDISGTDDSEDRLDIPVGTYDLMVMDENGCSQSIQVNITQPLEEVSTFISPTDTICNGMSNGIASITVNGGTGPYTYLWDNNSNNSTVNDLGPGIHYVTVSDNANCTYIDTVFIEEVAAINLDLTQVGALCNNGTDGSANLNAIFYDNTSAPFEDFEINWSVNGNQNMTAIEGLIAGQVYSTTVTDAIGCTATASVTIDNPEPNGANIQEVRDISCFGGSDGTISAEGIGGTEPYSYLWSVNTGLQNTQTAENLSIGDYIVTITDANGCTSTTFGTVVEPTRLQIDFQVTDILCNGDDTGELNSFVQGGTSPYEYTWSNGETTAAIETITSDTYQLTIKDANDCILEEEAFVPQPEALGLDLETEDVSCYDGRDGRITFIPTGGTTPYSYSIDGGESYNGALVQIGLVADVYNAYLLDANGCKLDAGEYDIFEPDPIEVDLGQDLTVELGKDVQIHSEINNTNDPIRWFWTPEDSLSCTNCFEPWVRNMKFTTTYTLSVIDDKGCEGEDMITIFIEKPRRVFVPTGFTPNGDNVNDFLIVHGKDVKNILSYSVYDRWGEMVYTASNFDVNEKPMGWDGTYNGKEMSTGVYVWIVEVEYIDGLKDTFRGNTTLMR